MNKTKTKFVKNDLTFAWIFREQIKKKVCYFFNTLKGKNGRSVKSFCSGTQFLKRPNDNHAFNTVTAASVVQIKFEEFFYEGIFHLISVSMEMAFNSYVI